MDDVVYFLHAGSCGASFGNDGWNKVKFTQISQIGKRKENMKIFLTMFLLSFQFIACNPPEKIAYKTAVGAKAFLDSVKKAHGECTIPQAITPRVCTLLVQTTSAKDLLIDAGEAYCGGKTFDEGGACNAPKKGDAAYQVSIDKLSAALKVYQQAEKDLKGIL